MLAATLKNPTYENPLFQRGNEHLPRIAGTRKWSRWLRRRWAESGPSQFSILVRSQPQRWTPFP